MIGERGTRPGQLEALDYVPFHASGSPAEGEYRCAECGYGITVRTSLPRCPMCSGGSWEQLHSPRADGDGRF